ncbi:MAG: hypothetical protein LUD15_06045 [Bacteroides sp.]|nr:hypothetical protein [Bacteroides sp.]
MGNFEVKLNLIKTKYHNLNTALSYSQHYNDLKSKYYSASTTAESEQNNYAGRASLTYEK